MKVDTTKVSVIIPTLNEEKFLRQALKALELQKQLPFETIVVDGGSTDRTIKIAEDHGASVLILKRIDVKRRTVAAQRNLGATKAKGEILVFTDADTIFPPNWLSKIVEKFNEDPKLVALSGGNRPFDCPFYLKVEYMMYDLLRAFLSRLPGRSQRFLSNGYNFAIRKIVLMAVGGFNESLEKNIDGELGKRLRIRVIGKTRVFLDIMVSTSARRFKVLGFWKCHLYYLYVLENIIVSISKYKFWRGLTSLLDKYILLQY